MSPRRRPGCTTLAISILLGGAAIYLVIQAAIGLATGRTVATLPRVSPRPGPPRPIPLSGDPARWHSISELVFALGLLIVAIAFSTPEEEAALLRLKIALALVAVGVVGKLCVLGPMS